MERSIRARDAIERVTADLDGGDFARGDEGADFRDRGRDAHEPSTRGTLNSPAARSAAGAWLRIRSRSSDGTGTSSRAAASPAVAAGAPSMPDVSTCCTWSAYARMAVSWPAKTDTSSGVSSRRASVAMRSTSACVRMSAMGVNSTRPAAVAGAWYPASPRAPARDVDRYLAEGPPSGALPKGRLDAVIAPHAGLMFSGPVGAYAYSAAAAHGPFDAVILAGPSHFVAFEGVALYPSGAFESPLGPAPIDEQLGRELMAASPLIRALPAAHAREHSLEMQLPFLRRLLPDAAIVPLLMGYQTRDTIRGLGDALARVAADHPHHPAAERPPPRAPAPPQPAHHG